MHGTDLTFGHQMDKVSIFVGPAVAVISRVDRDRVNRRVTEMSGWWAFEHSFLGPIIGPTTRERAEALGFEEGRDRPTGGVWTHEDRDEVFFPPEARDMLLAYLAGMDAWWREEELLSDEERRAVTDALISTIAELKAFNDSGFLATTISVLESAVAKISRR